MTDPVANPDETRVLYNAECPVCNFEISHYRDYSQNADLPIAFDDLNSAQLARWGLTQDTAARRLYVQKGGELISGIPAFIVLWQDMPKYRWLARLVSLPVVHFLANLAYDYALAPIIYRWHLLRKARVAKRAESSKL